MVHNSTKYLLLRGSTFHFRWRVPAELRLVFGATELRRSLRTTDHLQAGIRAGRFVTAVGAIQGVQRGYLMGEVALDDYQRISTQHWKSMSDTTKIWTITTYDGVTIDYDGDLEKEVKAYKALGYGHSNSNSKPDQINSSSTLLFSELFSKFMAHKTNAKEMSKEKDKKGKQLKPISLKVQQNHRRHFDGLIAIIGDLPICSITRNTLRDAILTYANLPKRNLKAYKNVPVLELLESDYPEEHRISDKTALEVKKSVQGFFAYATQKESFKDSPAQNLGLQLNATCTFASYSDHEIHLIVKAAFHEPIVWRRWLPTIAAYTGMRRGEIVQLRKQDVKFDSDSSRHYILVTEDAGSTKTKAATRQIPIHKLLIDKGFLEFVGSAGDKLFGDLKAANVTQWFTGLREKLEIEKFDDFGNRKVFHSLRHSFITHSLGAGNSISHLQQVVGHEQSKLGITTRYIHQFSIKNTLDVVDKVDYGRDPDKPTGGTIGYMY
jgi:integrase